MRLYLSSFRLGDAGETLLRLIGTTSRVAIIPNALDLIAEEHRERYRVTTYDPVAEFAQFGLQADLVDLRDHFGDTELAPRLSPYGLVWVLGGNSFVLRRAMAQSGFDRAIAAALADDSLVYGGFSAGTVVATPTLRGIEIMDDPFPLPPGYDPSILWDGLGLVDFSIVPHVSSDHPETALAALALTRLSELGLAHRALRDGEVLVREGDVFRLLGGRP